MNDDSTRSSTVSRRAALRSLAATASVLVGGFGGNAAAATSDSPRLALRDRAAQESQSFVGTATTTVRYLGSTLDEVELEETYENPVTVEIGPPVTVGAAREPNQFSLRVVPRVPLLLKSEDALGDLQVLSAEAITSELIAFWDLTVASATEFSGVLTDNHLEDGNTYNWLIATILGQGIEERLVLREGSRLEGTVEGDQITLSVTGNTVDGNTPFVSTVVASSN